MAALRDRYVLERELGRGGMATVYLAHDLRHKRPVALKVLHPELAQALGPERFLREIQVAAHHGDTFMFSRQILFVLVISGPALSACQPKAENARSLADADRNEMRTIVAEFDQAVLAANWPKVVSFYSEDGMLLPPNGPVVQGRAAMQTFFEGWPRITEIKQSIPEIEGDGDLASVRGTYDMTVIPPGAKTPLKDTGKSLAVWQKQADGSWRVRRVMWNSDLAPAR